MLIVDGQIHLWEKGTPSPPHRQEPYSAEQAIAAMDEGGVDRALIHPVLWDPDSNELAVEAVRKYPDRFAIMGWFYLDDPNGPDLVARWKKSAGQARPALLFQRAAQAGVDDRREPRLAMARGRAGRRAGGARRRVVPADCRPDRRASPGAQTDRRPHGGAAREQRRVCLSLPARPLGA